MDSMKLNRARSVATWIVLVTVVLTGQKAECQIRRSRTPEVARVLMLAPREYQQQLKQAEQALAEEEYSEAIEHLARLLHSDATERARDSEIAEDFFVGRPGENHYQTSLRAQARRLLGSMPAEGRELYELQFGADARRMLKAALSSSDIGQLSEVSRQYFHTKAGYTGTMLLGRVYLDTGRPLAAAMCFSRLADAEQAVRRYDPELSLLLANSWHMSGLREKAEEVLEDLRQRRPDASFTIQGSEVAIYTADDSPLAWLERVMSPPSELGHRLASEWRMHRGVPTRNAETDGSLPLLRTRWRVQVANDPDDEEMVKSLMATHQEETAAAIPSLSPLIVDGVLLMKTTDNMMAVDFATGKRIWEYPWSEPLSMNLNEDDAPAPSPDARRKQLDERVWMDAIYGQMSSDGKSLFLIDDLGFTQQSAAGLQIRMIRGMPTENPDQPKNYNSLVALDVATEGKYRWRVGGVNGEDEPALAGAFFLGAPLVLSDELYVLAEIRGDISLVVLDAEKGKVRWTQQLAHVGQVNILNDTVRRLAGATPSFSDGVLICPTSGGAVVAVDIPNRSLLWGYQYRRSYITYTHNGMRINGVYTSNQTRRERWADATATIADGRVIVTPAEGDELHCLDLLTGEPVWKAKRRNDSLYVACVHEGKIVLVGKRHVTAWNLSDGQQTWQLPVGSERDTSGTAAVPSGRGFLSGHSYYLPTSLELMQIDVRDGSLVEAIRTDQPLGNLLSYRDHVVSLGPDYLTTFFRIDRLQQIVHERLAKNPQDPWSIEQQGLLLLDQGQRDEALRSLRKAFDLYGPKDDRREGTKTLLVETLLEALEDDFAANGQLAAEVNELIDRPLQREKYLRLMGKGLLESGRARAAFDAFLELAFHQFSPKRGSTFQGVTLPLLENGSRAHLVRRDRFVRSGIRESLSLASDADRTAMVATINNRLADALSDSGVGPLKRLLNVFADHESAADVRFELATRYVEAGELLRAEIVLGPLLHAADDATAATAWAQMARVMEEAHQYAVAAQCYDTLIRRWPTHICWEGKTAGDIIAQMSIDSPLASRLAGVPRWPYGRVSVERVSGSRPSGLSSRFQPYANFRPIRILQTAGALRPDIQVQFDATGSNAIVVKDTIGQERLRIAGSGGRIRRFSENTLTCKALGHLLIVNAGQGILAANVLQSGLSQEKRILWPDSYNELLTSGSTRRDALGQASLSTNAWRQREFDVTGRRVNSIGPINYDGIIYQQGNRLICVDPITGEDVWIRHDITPQADLWGDEEYLFVADKSSEARVFRCLDGVEVGQRVVPDPSRRWKTVGRRVLTWSDENRDGRPTWMLRLYDPWAKEDIWKRPFRAYSRGYVTREGQVAVVQETDEFTLLDLETGKVLVQHQLEAAAGKPEGVYLLPSDDQFLLVVGFKPRHVKGISITSFPDSNSAPLIDSHVYAFDRRTGSAQWQVPAIVEGYSLPLTQPTNLPVLAFVRQEFHSSSRARGRAQLALLCLDKRDGRIVADIDKLTSSYGSFQMIGDDAEKSMTLQLLNVHVFRLNFTHDPQPPEPPAQTGSAASRPKGAGLSSIVGALFGAFGRQVQKQGERTEKEVNRILEKVERNAAPQDESVKKDK